MCEDTNLKAIHNGGTLLATVIGLSSMREDTNLKAIHNTFLLQAFQFFVVFNVQRY